MKKILFVASECVPFIKQPRLERVEADVMGNFKRLGVPSEPMDGRARLALLHSCLLYTSSGGIHPTQKPVELCEYLIRTYTRPGELVAEMCIRDSRPGAWTDTGLSAEQTGSPGRCV